MSSPSHPPELAVTIDGDVPAPAKAPDTVGGQTRIGRYLLLRLLGEGGMGVVYTAWDELLDRRVALKLLRADHDGDAHARMLHEAKGLARLSHPHVVQIYEVSTSAGRLFIAMEYIQGSTLRDWTAEQRRLGADLRVLVNMYIQAGRGLAAAHAQGLVHRDFKPDNVLVGEDGRARVVDFGLVTTRDAGGESLLTSDPGVALDEQLTVDGTIVGTPAYMPPEQFMGRPTDARSDQFSFCAALYEALCGVRAFTGESFTELRAAVVSGVVRAPNAQHPLPAWLSDTLRRGLAPRPDDRFPTMDALLTRLAHDPDEARRRRRRAAALAFAGAVVAVLLVLLTVELRQRWHAHQRERDAELARAATEARIDEARATANEAVAREAFAAFVADPLHDGTRALTRAWLDEAGRRRSDPAPDEARAAYAAAYASATTPDLQVEALRGLAEGFRRGLDWDSLANVLGLLDREHPGSADALADLRVEVALARRDITGAWTLLAGAAGERAALTDALRSATATAHRDIVDVRAGVGRVALLERHLGQPRLRVVQADAALTPVFDFPAPPGTTALLLLTNDLEYVVGHGPEGERNTVYRVGPAGLTPLHRWQGSQIFVGATADLDGDGRRELYLGTGTGLEIVTLVELPDGSFTIRVVYTATDTLDSAAYGLAAADLDGDGREELAASFTGWRAYDVRVLRRGSDGSLQTLARDKLGTVLGVAPLRGPDGSRRLVSKNVHMDASPLVFPAAHPQGESEGLYLHEFADSRFTRRQHLPLGLPPGASAQRQWAPAVGDINGDGRDDIAVGFDRAGTWYTSLYLQTDVGEFTPTVLGHVQLLGLAQLDADPAQELITSVVDEAGARRLWVLGAGADQLPPVPDPTPRAVEEPSTRPWRQAQALHDLGLVAEAATAFEQIARRSPDPELRAASSLAAGRLRARSGQDRPALALLHEASRAREHRAAALREALTIELRLGDYEAAQTSLEALRVVPDGGDDDLARLGALITRARQERIDLRFDAALDRRWQIVDPLGLRREPGGESLELATHGIGVLAALPVRWSGDLIELSADFTLEELEHGSQLDIELVPEADPEGPPLVGIHVGVSGTRRGGLAVVREYSCATAGRGIGDLGHPKISQRPEHSVHLEMRASAVPAIAQLGCDLFEHTHGGSRSQREHLTRPLPPAGRYLLRIRAGGDAPAWLHARLHRITLRGVQLVDDPASDRHALHSAIVEDDPRAMLAALDALTELSPREQVWRAHALLRVGRGEVARPLLADLLASSGPTPPALMQLLRADPGLSPLFAELAGPRHLEIVREVWRSAAVNHLDDPRPRRALRAVLVALDADALLATPDLGALDHACELLRWRADIHARDGETARARADLERVLAATDRLPAEASQRRGRWLLWIELASLAARGAEPARVSEAIQAALRDGPPLLVGDILRARPELAAFAP